MQRLMCPPNGIQLVYRQSCNEIIYINVLIISVIIWEAIISSLWNPFRAQED